MSKKEKDDCQQTIKIILLGDAGVGKTAIINRYYSNNFNQNIKPTFAMNFVEKYITIKGKKMELNIWDTAGQEKFRSCNKLFVKYSNIVIFVYDITSQKSFESLEYWYNFIQNELGQDYTIGLAGNKIDLVKNEEVSEEEAKKKAEEWGAHFSLLSAKQDQEGIDQFFNDIVTKFVDSIDDDFVLIEAPNSYRTIKLEKDIIIKIDEKKSCCGGDDGINKEGDLNIIFLGSKGVGKTNIIQKIRGYKITKNYIPTKDLTKITFVCQLAKKRSLNVNIFDTVGDFSYNNVLINLFKTTNIFFLVFDLNKRSTFDELEKWIKEIKKYSEKKILIKIIGNKIQKANKTNKTKKSNKRNSSPDNLIININNSNQNIENPVPDNLNINTNSYINIQNSYPDNLNINTYNSNLQDNSIINIISNSNINIRNSESDNLIINTNNSNLQDNSIINTNNSTNLNINDEEIEKFTKDNNCYYEAISINNRNSTTNFLKKNIELYLKL